MVRRTTVPVAPIYDEHCHLGAREHDVRAIPQMTTVWRVVHSVPEALRVQQLPDGELGSRVASTVRSHRFADRWRRRPTLALLAHPAARRLRL